LSSDFAAIDRYIEDLFVPPDAALEAAVRSIAETGMPPIQVSAAQGKLLYLLARLCRAQRILEIGTLAGYSTIWLARALPADGRLVSLERNPRHAEVARGNLARAGVGARVEVIVGPALETLPLLSTRGEGPFDIVFIDADKESYSAYLEWSLRLTRSRSLIVADNVVRGGRVLSPDPPDEADRGARAFNAALAADPRVEAVVLQQVGVKGHDGMAIAVVK
jgi:predicted O-methyltransferase YrrM